MGCWTEIGTLVTRIDEGSSESCGDKWGIYDLSVIMESLPSV